MLGWLIFVAMAITIPFTFVPAISIPLMLISLLMIPLVAFV
jgi:hypothetical protein